MEKMNIGAAPYDDSPYKPENIINVEDETEKQKEKNVISKFDKGKEIVFDACDDIKNCDIGNFDVDETGKILRLSLTLKDVCPRKRVALAVMLYELDSRNKKYERGLKIITIQKSKENVSRDIKVKDIVFVLPNDIGVGTNGRRRFVASVKTNYIDVVEDNCCRSKDNGKDCNDDFH